MLKAVLRQGVIVPLEPLPPEWEEGAALEVAKADASLLDIDAWAKSMNQLCADSADDDEEAMRRATTAPAASARTRPAAGIAAQPGGCQRPRPAPGSRQSPGFGPPICCLRQFALEVSHRAQYHLCPVVVGLRQIRYEADVLECQ